MPERRGVWFPGDDDADDGRGGGVQVSVGGPYWGVVDGES